MIYQSPSPLPAVFSNPSVFIAGGISNCPDWQSDIISSFNTALYDVVNPRRVSGFDSTGETAKEQISWEHHALSICDSCVFWFPKETVCPITLLELGKMLVLASKHSVRLSIGWHHDYQRAFDLKVQIELESHAKNHIIYYGAGWDPFKNCVETTWG